MSPKIRATPPSAAASCNRIDFVASRVAAGAWWCWLGCAAVVTITADLAWVLRLSIAVLAVASGSQAVRRHILLRGPCAVRALEWQESAGAPVRFYLWLGEPARRLPAIPHGCRRYGAFLWLLRFDTAEGTRQLLVNPACQEPVALRRLSRRLDWDSG
jgi:uncharacterized membrane protein YphA (DoxX/SURF4 family)